MAALDIEVQPQDIHIQEIVKPGAYTKEINRPQSINLGDNSVMEHSPRKRSRPLNSGQTDNKQFVLIHMQMKKYSLTNITSYHCDLKVSLIVCLFWDQKFFIMILKKTRNGCNHLGSFAAAARMRRAEIYELEFQVRGDLCKLFCPLGYLARSDSIAPRKHLLRSYINTLFFPMGLI